MKHLIRAITEWFEADAERIRENTRIAEAGTYMRGVMDGREDIMDTFGLEVTYLGGEDGRLISKSRIKGVDHGQTNMFLRDGHVSTPRRISLFAL